MDPSGISIDRKSPMKREREAKQRTAIRAAKRVLRQDPEADLSSLRVTPVTDFFACFGVLFAVALVVGAMSQTSINLGWYGLLGFPLLSLIYALIRRPQRRAAFKVAERLRLRILLLEAGEEEERLMGMTAS
ncbi:MAG: hypothetical protein R3F30_07230 [Planctomycetota bacterium]